MAIRLEPNSFRDVLRLRAASAGARNAIDAHVQAEQLGFLICQFRRNPGEATRLLEGERGVHAKNGLPSALLRGFRQPCGVAEPFSCAATLSKGTR
jgi:hypothetical protein